MHGIIVLDLNKNDIKKSEKKYELVKLTYISFYQRKHVFVKVTVQ